MHNRAALTVKYVKGDSFLYLVWQSLSPLTFLLALRLSAFRLVFSSSLRPSSPFKTSCRTYTNPNHTGYQEQTDMQVLTLFQKNSHKQRSVSEYCMSFIKAV